VTSGRTDAQPFLGGGFVAQVLGYIRAIMNFSVRRPAWKTNDHVRENKVWWLGLKGAFGEPRACNALFEVERYCASKMPVFVLLKDNDNIL
jgi:hypothetical protein